MSLLLAALAAPRLLFLGNSYTFVEDLDQLTLQALTEAPGWEAVSVEALTAGGLSLADHLARVKTDPRWTTALTDDGEEWTWGILQDQSQIPGFPSTDEDFQASLSAALSLDLLLTDRKARSMFLMTWGRRDGDEENPELFPDFTTMQDRLTEGYLAYASVCSSTDRKAAIAPVGRAFQVVYDGILDLGEDPSDPASLFYALYNEDGSHPSLEGSWLASWTLYAALTGRSPVGLPAPDGWPGDEDSVVVLQQAADKAVLDDPFGTIPYPFVWSFADWFAANSQEEGTGNIGGVLEVPWVHLEEEGGSWEELVLAGGKESVGEGARLFIGEGGSLDVSSLVLASPGSAWLLLQGGTLTAEAVAAAVTTDSEATFRVEEGTLSVTTLEAGLGTCTFQLLGGELRVADTLSCTMVHEGGTLTANGDHLILGEGYTLGMGARLQTFQGSPVHVLGTANLLGSLAWEGVLEEGDESLILEATVLDVTHVHPDLPEGVRLDQRDTGSGVSLWAVEFEGGDDDSASDDDSAGEDDDASSDDDSADGNQGGASCNPGCGDGKGGLAGFLLLGWRRRNRTSRRRASPLSAIPSR